MAKKGKEELNITDPTISAEETRCLSYKSMSLDEYQQLISDMYDLSNNIDEEFLLSFASIFEYEGFKPRKLVLRMKKLWEWHSEEIVRNPNKLKTISMKDNNIYTSNESFESDIQIICKAFLIGKRFYNDNGMRSIMNMMINKYSIDTKRRPPGTTVDNRTITIPRIASAFPVVTVDLGYKGHGIVRVDSKDLIGVEWPRAFLTPNIASIIPKDLNDKPLAQLLMLSVEAHALNPRIKTSKKPINLTYLYQCLMNSYKSDIVDKDVQLKKCKEWGIIDANNQLIPEIRDSKQACISMIRARKSGDPALEKIIQDL